MVRDLDRLTARTFDLLVVGGGIYGLAIAYDAAQRGVSVALIEGADFGGGLSFNHLRTIHGGLRYLQTLDLRRARESVRERATFARIAPHAVRPIPFALPLVRSIKTGKIAMRAGFLLDRLVSFDRNRRVPDLLRLPGGHVVSRAEVAARFPGIQRRHLTGAAVWYDYLTIESDRLTFSFALAAEQHGAVLANHLEAVEPIADRQRVGGVRAIDRLGDRTIEIAARVTINATGAAIDRLLMPLGAATGLPRLRAMNLVTTRVAGDEALGGRTPAGRALFLVPWRGRAVAGTWESATPVCAEPGDVAHDDVAAFIAELNQAFPALDLKADEISLVHRGVVPAVAKPGGRMALEGHERVHDHAREGIEGILSVAGTKYTTARLVAERIVDQTLSKMSMTPVPCRTATTLLPGSTEDDPALALASARRDHDEGLPGDTMPHLLGAYGSRYHDVLSLAATRADWTMRVAADSPVIAAELVYAVRHEMALTLADAVIRRTPLGALGRPSDAALNRAAAIVGDELNWTESRRRDEVAAVGRFYELPR